MANLKIKDGDGNPKYVKATGDGTANLPYISEQKTEVTALPALPAGSNLIGKVDVTTMPTVSFSQGSSIGISSLPALPAGSNTIGKVEVNFPVTQTIAGTVSISNSSIEIANDVGNPIPVNIIKPTTINTGVANPWTVSSTVSSVPANSNRKGLTIYNPLSFDVFVGVQNTVSSNSFLVKLTQDFNYYEFPYNYVGDVFIVCASGNTGNVYVREFI